MARNLLLISLGVNFAHAGAARKPVHPMALQDARDRRVRHLDIVIALQVPNDPHWAEMVFATKIQHLFLALGRCPIGMPFGNRRRIDQASFASLGIGIAPTVKTGTANPKIPTGPGNVADRFSAKLFCQAIKRVVVGTVNTGD